MKEMNKPSDIMRPVSALGNLILVISVCLLGSSCMHRVSSRSEVLPTMRIYYVNFGVAPYEPLTRKEMEQYPLYKIWFYGKHHFNSDIVSMLEGFPVPAGSRMIDPKMLRLVVDMKGPKDAVFVVDENGSVLEEKSGSMYTVDRKTIDTLDKVITSYHGVADQWPSRDVWGEDTEKWYPTRK